jgi:histone-lysine N-methyltransferase SETMAR
VDAHTFTKQAEQSLNKRLPARKLMAIVFWDVKGVLMVGFMQQGTTVTSEVYCETLKKLRRADHPEQKKWNAVFLHDNARSYRAARTRALLGHFNWELFDHPPYSPDLAPRDYHLCAYRKNWMESQLLNNNEDFIKEVKTYVIEITGGRRL